MRIWSLHPRYLDPKGLVALWRETLLAKKVLKGNTVGYKNHPQLQRFRESANAENLINKYLEYTYDEAVVRGYSFNKDKFTLSNISEKITVNSKQLEYEFEHLLRKVKIRDKAKYNELIKVSQFEPHPIFKVVDGEIENWEII